MNEKAKKTPVSPRRKNITPGIVGALILIGIGAAGALLVEQNIRQPEVTPRESITAGQEDGNNLVSSEEATIANVVERVSPSVVSVVTEVVTGNSYWGARVSEGAGSGMIVSRDGYVLTNKHVVEGAREVNVVLSDGTTHSGVKVVNKDPLNDIAFLKIPNVDNLTPATLGDSTTVKIGQHAIAIGNSLGQYQNTVTNGIISGTGRPIAAKNNSGDIETLTDLLQTDAAINPGNSGGPLLNAAGQVIGVNTAIAAGAEGIGFAIPINATKGLLKQVIEGKDAKRAYLGVRYLPVNAELAKKYKLSVKQGAYVMSESRQSAVAKNSPADKAGIKKDDVITKIGEIEVGPRGGVSSLIAEYAPGDTIDITYVRGDKEQTVRVTLDTYRD